MTTASAKPRLIFSVRSMLFVMTCVVVLMSSRELFVYKHHTGLGTTISRAKAVSLMFASAATLYACTQRHPDNAKHRLRILRACVVGGTTGLLVALCLGIEIAEGVRKLYPDHWSWTRDIAVFAWVMTLVTVGSAVAGIVTSSLYYWSGHLFKRIGRTNP